VQYPGLASEELDSEGPFVVDAAAVVFAPIGLSAVVSVAPPRKEIDSNYNAVFLKL
jgi:hypothetical protein